MSSFFKTSIKQKKDIRISVYEYITISLSQVSTWKHVDGSIFEWLDFDRYRYMDSHEFAEM